MEKFRVFSDGPGERFTAQFLHMRLILSEPVFHIDQVLLDGERLLVNRAPGHQPLILGQIAVTAVSLKRNGSAVGSFLSDDDL